jgi:hypothetical protein
LGESGDEPVPKEQPPRKLSGKRTSSGQTELWREAPKALAEGITISGKGTEGAHEKGAISAPEF